MLQCAVWQGRLHVGEMAALGFFPKISTPVENTVEKRTVAAELRAVLPDFLMFHPVEALRKVYFLPFSWV